MEEIKIRKRLWKEFVAVARKERKSPNLLVQKMLEEYLQRVEDEKLLRDSRRDARRSPYRFANAEEIIRQFRQKK